LRPLSRTLGSCASVFGSSCKRLVVLLRCARGCVVATSVCALPSCLAGLCVCLALGRACIVRGTRASVVSVFSLTRLCWRARAAVLGPRWPLCSLCRASVGTVLASRASVSSVCALGRSSLCGICVFPAPCRARPGGFGVLACAHDVPPAPLRLVGLGLFWGVVSGGYVGRSCLGRVCLCKCWVSFSAVRSGVLKVCTVVCGHGVCSCIGRLCARPAFMPWSPLCVPFPGAVVASVCALPSCLVGL
jgi:hypothetical protein